MRRADTTFVNLRATLDDLQPLVDESKPVAKKLRPFLAELRPLARDARPTLRDLSRARALARRLQRPHRADEVLGAAAQRRRGADQAQRQAARRRLPGLDQGARGRPRPSWPRRGPTRPTSPAGSTTSATRASTTRSAAPAAPALYVNLFAPVNGVLKPLLDPLAQSDALKNADLAGPALALPGLGRARRDLEARPPTSPATRPKGRSGHEARARSPSSLVAGLGVALHRARPARARTPTRASTGSQFDNAFGLIQGGDLKVAGVRAGKITDIKLDKRTKHALVGFKIDKNGFGSLRIGHLLRVAPAVADRRVLRRLPARHGQAGAQAGRGHPGHAARPRPSRPTSSTTSCAAPTASA